MAFCVQTPGVDLTSQNDSHTSNLDETAQYELLNQSEASTHRVDNPGASPARWVRKQRARSLSYASPRTPTAHAIGRVAANLSQEFMNCNHEQDTASDKVRAFQSPQRSFLSSVQTFVSRGGVLPSQEEDEMKVYNPSAYGPQSVISSPTLAGQIPRVELFTPPSVPGFSSDFAVANAPKKPALCGPASKSVAGNGYGNVRKSLLEVMQTSPGLVVNAVVSAIHRHDFAAEASMVWEQDVNTTLRSKAATLADVSGPIAASPPRIPQQLTKAVKISERLGQALSGVAPPVPSKRSHDCSGLDVSEITKIQSFATGFSALNPDIDDRRYSKKARTTAIAFGRGVRSPQSAVFVRAPEIQTDIEGEREQCRLKSTSTNSINQLTSSLACNEFAIPEIDSTIALRLQSFEQRVQQLATRLQTPPTELKEEVPNDSSVPGADKASTETPEVHTFSEPAWAAAEVPNTSLGALDKVRRYLDEFRKSQAAHKSEVFEIPLPSTSHMHPTEATSIADPVSEAESVYAYVPSSRQVLPTSPAQFRRPMSFVTPPPSPPRDSVGNVILARENTVDPSSAGKSRLKWFGVNSSPQQAKHGSLVANSTSTEVARNLFVEFVVPAQASGVNMHEPTPLPRPRAMLMPSTSL
jgi:hypothetical protein